MSTSISSSRTSRAPLATFEFTTIEYDLAVSDCSNQSRSESFSTATSAYQQTQEAKVLSSGSESKSESGRVEESRPNGILIAEDNWLLRKSLGEVFRDQGFDLWTAANGSEAVELYQQFWPLIDIVLCDVQMPVMDGTKALEALRKINPSLRFCFMTGDTRTNKRANLLRLGAMRVFEKPFPSIAELAQDLWDLATTPIDLSGQQTSEIARVCGPHQSIEGPHFRELPCEGRSFEWAYAPLLSSLSRITTILTKPRSPKLDLGPPTPIDY